MEQSQPAARGQSLLEWYEALISAALVLVLGGGIGNLIDRVLNGEVVDYIKTHDNAGPTDHEVGIR